MRGLGEAMLASWVLSGRHSSERLGIFATGVNSKPTDRIKAWTSAMRARWLRGPLDTKHGLETQSSQKRDATCARSSQLFERRAIAGTAARRDRAASVAPTPSRQ